MGFVGGGVAVVFVSPAKHGRHIWTMTPLASSSASSSYAASHF